MYHTQGIVVGRMNYSETSIIARIYTERFGMQSYILKGVRKSHAQLKANQLEHLSLLDLVVYHSEKSDLQQIKEFKPAYVFQQLLFDVRKSSITLFINEIFNASVREEESNPALFHFFFESVKWLDNATESFSDFHLYFLIQLTHYLGFFPQNNFSGTNNVFNLKEGKFQATVPIHKNYLTLPLSEDFFHLITMPLRELRFTHPVRTALLNHMIEYFRIHLPGFKEIKSLSVLHTVLS